MNSNPLNMENEENADITDEYYLNPDGTIADKKNIVFGQQDFVVNIGPQHPSTHGVLRLRTSLNGETISKVDPICGYIHRGIEKMNESLTYPQTLAFDRPLDYLSAHQNRHALCMCIEKAAGSRFQNAHSISVPSWTNFSVSTLTCCSTLVWLWIWED